MIGPRLCQTAGPLIPCSLQLMMAFPSQQHFTTQQILLPTQQNNSLSLSPSRAVGLYLSLSLSLAVGLYLTSLHVHFLSLNEYYTHTHIYIYIYIYMFRILENTREQEVSGRPRCSTFSLLSLSLEMALWVSCSVALLLLVNFLRLRGGNSSESCDLYHGRWVFDPSYPPYNATTCPFIDKEFNCLNNGRPDFNYLKYRWQPAGCDLPRFNGLDFLRRYSGKNIMFVGDSLTRDQWQSFMCLLCTAAPNLTCDPPTRLGMISTLTVPEYEVTVWMDRNAYLVDLVNTTKGRILKVDSIEGGKNWKGMDMLIFNTWHWWNYRHSLQPWDYIEVGNRLLKDMDRMVAFKRGLGTWGKWLDANVDPTKTLVFFQGISPNHYNGSEWNEPKANKCLGQMAPVPGSTYPGPYPEEAVAAVKRALSKIKTPVTMLDITNLCLLRKDGHPSIYGIGGATGMDCTHWCVPGVPDTWNQILYNLIVST